MYKPMTAMVSLPPVPSAAAALTYTSFNALELGKAGMYLTYFSQVPIHRNTKPLRGRAIPIRGVNVCRLYTYHKLSLLLIALSYLFRLQR